MNNPDRISESLKTIFLVKILKFFYVDPGSRMEKIRIWDGKKSDPGITSRIRNIGFCRHRFNPDRQIRQLSKSRMSVATLSATGTRRRPGWDGSWAAFPLQPASPGASWTCSRPSSCRSSGKLEFKQFNWIWILVGLLESFGSKSISKKQCCGSMTFWGRSGFADPCLWLMDPDPGSGPCYFRHWPSRCQQKLIF